MASSHNYEAEQDVGILHMEVAETLNRVEVLTDDGY